MSESNNNERRFLPRTDLDFNLMTTDSAWGRAEINPELYDKLKKKTLRLVQKVNEEGVPLFYPKLNEEGLEVPDLDKPVLTYDEIGESLWAQLGFFTRDLRLSNLSKLDGELSFVNYALDLAAKFGDVGMHRPQVLVLATVASITEPAQSKGGFLRRRMNTLTQEHFSGETEPNKKSLFGKKAKET